MTTPIEYQFTGLRIGVNRNLEDSTMNRIIVIALDSTIKRGDIFLRIYMHFDSWINGEHKKTTKMNIYDYTIDALVARSSKFFLTVPIDIGDQVFDGDIIHLSIARINDGRDTGAQGALFLEGFFDWFGEKKLYFSEKVGTSRVGHGRIL